MRLYDTQLGKWLALIRIQSTPLTVVSLIIGYLTVEMSLSMDVLPLVIVGALGHWGFYTLNDVYDVLIDTAQGKDNKPLVDGDIGRPAAEIAAVIFITASILGAMLWFGTFATAMYLFACGLGWIYNRYSKHHTYSAFYLGGWGVSIIWVGALYAGAFELLTVILSLLLGLHMIWMTVMGDLKDIDGDEPNLVQECDCRVVECPYSNSKHEGELMLVKTVKFQTRVALPLLMIQFALASGAVAYNASGATDIMVGGLVFVFGALFVVSGWTIGGGIPYSTESITGDIVMNEMIGVMMILGVLMSHISLEGAAILFFSSVAWGLSWQKIQFGKALYFP